MVVTLPIGKIETPERLGEVIKAHRKFNRLTQAEIAALAGVGNRFISELENGKPGVQLDKILQVLASLGLELHINRRQW
jgi:HTH-type transcriptional regulator/antitoxin HipB